MTIQEIASKLNRFEENPGETLPEHCEYYNEALSDIEAGELGDAKKNLRKAVRGKSDFDDGNMLLGLVLFAMGNRIDCMRQINEIDDAKKHEQAMDFVDALSSNGRKMPKTVESETPDEREARRKDETVTVRIFDDESKNEETEKTDAEDPLPAADDSNDAPPSGNSFEKLFKKAKQAQNEDLLKFESGDNDSESLVATKVSGTPIGNTSVIAASASTSDTITADPIETSEEPRETDCEEIPEVPEDNAEPAEPEEPVTLVFDFEKMFDTGYSGEINFDTDNQPEPTAEDKTAPEISDVQTEARPEDDSLTENPDNETQDAYVAEELLGRRNRTKAILAVGAGIAVLALIAFIAWKLSL